MKMLKQNQYKIKNVVILNQDPLDETHLDLIGGAAGGASMIENHQNLKKVTLHL
jgi:hypothetical protein